MSTDSAFAVQAAEGRITVTVPCADSRCDAGSLVSLELETLKIARGQHSLTRGVVEHRVGTRGRLEIARGGVTETWSSAPAGSEQAWRFDVTPRGRGDLVVEVRTRGAVFTGTSDEGLHFSASGVGILYGHATFIDAEGVRTHIPVTFEGGRIILRVPAAVLATSSFPAVLDPLVGPEVRAHGGEHTQRLPAVGTNGTDFLVAWVDERHPEGPAVYAARVHADGVVLDPLGIHLATFPHETSAGIYPVEVHDVAIAWNGMHYFVVWGLLRGGDLKLATVGGIAVSNDGSVLGTRLPLGGSDRVAETPRPRIASDGQSFFVAWRDRVGFSSGGIAGSLVTWSGSRYVRSELALGVGCRETVHDVSFHGAGYLIVREEGTFAQCVSEPGAYAARVSTAGMPLPGPRLAMSLPGQARTAFNGTNVLVAWPDSVNTNQIAGVRVSADGTRLDAQSRSLAPVVSLEGFELTAAGTGYVVTFLDGDGPAGAGIYQQKLNGNAARVGEIAQLVPASVDDRFAFASGGPNAGLLVYSRTESGATRVFARVVTDDITLDDTCDGVDDDGEDGVDEDFVVGITTCGPVGCPSRGMRTCATGHVLDSCVAEHVTCPLPDAATEPPPHDAGTPPSPDPDAGDAPPSGGTSGSCAVFPGSSPRASFVASAIAWAMLIARRVRRRPR